MSTRYFPSSDSEWERISSPALEDAAARFSSWETSVPIDLQSFKYQENTDLGEGEYAPIIGPLPDRGPATGIVLQSGRIAAIWGAPERRDTAFSVSKGCLGILTGLALDRGLIPALDAPVSATVQTPEFSSGANAAITWRHLMTLTSEWEGTLWGIPDSIDFHRNVPKGPEDLPKGSPRKRYAPGQKWEFNDVRVNAFALALTHAWQEPLDLVLQREIARPIGIPDGWDWSGYNNSITTIDGRQVPVVVGGAHWGGGLIASSFDLARLGLLYATRGAWAERQLVSAPWFDALRSPTPLKPEFGLIWWNNSTGAIAPLSRQAIWSAGIANFLAVDPVRDIVVVLRWFDIPRRNEILSELISLLPPARL